VLCQGSIDKGRSCKTGARDYFSTWALCRARKWPFTKPAVIEHYP